MTVGKQEGLVEGTLVRSTAGKGRCTMSSGIAEVVITHVRRRHHRLHWMMNCWVCIFLKKKKVFGQFGQERTIRYEWVLGKTHRGASVQGIIGTRVVTQSTQKYQPRYRTWIRYTLTQWKTNRRSQLYVCSKQVLVAFSPSRTCSDSG